MILECSFPLRGALAPSPPLAAENVTLTRSLTVRLCGDYKVTVNPALHVDQHPIPTLEQAFGGLAHGQRFTKIDLKSAYQQLVFDELRPVLLSGRDSSTK